MECLGYFWVKINHHVPLVHNMSISSIYLFADPLSKFITELRIGDVDKPLFRDLGNLS